MCKSYVVFSKYLIFPKNINKRMYKKQQNYFFDFFAQRGLIIAPTYLHVNGELELRSSF